MESSVLSSQGGYDKTVYFIEWTLEIVETVTHKTTYSQGSTKALVNSKIVKREMFEYL
jgi:hypothetical protein